MSLLLTVGQSTGGFAPASTLLFGALAFVVITMGLLIGTVLLVRWFGRNFTQPAPRPPCSFGPHCPCDCHERND